MGLPDSEKAMNTFLSSLPKSTQDELEKQLQSYMGMNVSAASIIALAGIDLARGKDMTAAGGKIIDG